MNNILSAEILIGARCLYRLKKKEKTYWKDKTKHEEEGEEALPRENCRYKTLRRFLHIL
jgi:hypothetical protein